MAIACNLCSGGNIRGDEKMRGLYVAIKDCEDTLQQLVLYSPCAATKMFLLTKDKRLGVYLAAQYQASPETLPACSNRKTLVDEVGHLQSTYDANGLPQLHEIARAIGALLVRGTTSPHILGVHTDEEYFGRPNPALDPLTRQAAVLRQEI